MAHTIKQHTLKVLIAVMLLVVPVSSFAFNEYDKIWHFSGLWGQIFIIDKLSYSRFIPSLQDLSVFNLRMKNNALGSDLSLSGFSESSKSGIEGGILNISGMH
jgi:hypothetical protein